MRFEAVFERCPAHFRFSPHIDQTGGPELTCRHVGLESAMRG